LLALAACAPQSEVQPEAPAAMQAKHGEFANESLRVGYTTRV